jgi:hypothetical protein
MVTRLAARSRIISPVESTLGVLVWSLIGRRRRYSVKPPPVRLRLSGLRRNILTLLRVTRNNGRGVLANFVAALLCRWRPSPEMAEAGLAGLGIAPVFGIDVLPLLRILPGYRR